MTEPTPRDFTQTPNSICSWGLTTHLMTGFLLQHLRRHFASAERLENAQIMRNYLWVSESSSNLLIESLYQWRPETSSQRPAILIRGGSLEYMRLGINDELYTGKTETDTQRFSVAMRGSHTIFVLTRTAGECELLKAEVYRELMFFGPQIRALLNLMRFGVAEVGMTQPVLEAKEHFGAPITLAYVAPQNWEIYQHAPTLTHIDFGEFIP